MAKQLRIKARAYQDVDDHCDNIAQFNSLAAARFKEKVLQTFQFLLDFPESGSLCEVPGFDQEGLRFTTVQKYKRYVILFRPTSDGVEIIRVIHGAQDIEGILRGES